MVWLLVAGAKKALPLFGERRGFGVCAAAAEYELIWTELPFRIGKEEFNRHTLVKAHHQRVPVNAIVSKANGKPCYSLNDEGLILFKTSYKKSRGKKKEAKIFRIGIKARQVAATGAAAGKNGETDAAEWMTFFFAAQKRTSERSEIRSDVGARDGT